MAEAGGGFLRRINDDLGARDTVPRAGDLNEHGVVDHAVQEIGLHHDGRARFAPRAIAVGPIQLHDIAALHACFRMRSSSAGLSQFRLNGFTIPQSKSYTCRLMSMKVSPVRGL